MVLPLFAAIDRFDFKLIEAGYDLYASRWQILRNVVLPIIRPGIVAGCILVFVPSLGAYVTPRVLGGGKNMMIGNFIELQFGQGQNWPLGAALSMVLLAIVLGALLVYTRVSSREGPHG
jgi:spermidine/putrescine transport system permease protein